MEIHIDTEGRVPGGALIVIRRQGAATQVLARAGRLHDELLGLARVALTPAEYEDFRGALAAPPNGVGSALLG